MDNNEPQRTIPEDVINKWYGVSVEAYSIANELAKERFEDVLSESQSITDKSIKIVSGIFVLTAYFIGLAITKQEIIKNHSCLLLLIAIGIGSILIRFIYLILPKNTKNRGLSPISAFQKNFDNDEDKDHQTQLIYYISLSVLQDNIDFMIKKNKERADVYQFALISSMILFLMVIPFATVYIIFHP